MLHSITSLLVSFMLLSSCNNPGKEKEPEKKIDSPAVVEDTIPKNIGGDKDEHGCLTSAGYRWSIVKNNCVRLFESGIAMGPADPKLDKTSIAYLLFTDDKVSVEIFLPTQKKAVIIRKSSAAGEPAKWANGPLTLAEVDGIYTLYDEGNVLYKSKAN